MKKYILLFVFVCACLGQSTSFPPNSSGGPVGPYVIDFNTRSNHVTLSSGDVTTALGFTPVQGPGSVVSGHIATFNGTSGATLQDGGVLSRSIGAAFSNNGATVSTASSVPFTIPYGCTIAAYNASVTPSGTATFTFWKISSGTAIPTISNLINTSGVGVSTGTSVHSATVTDFTTTTVTANDIVIVNLTAVTGSPTGASINLQCN